MRWDVFISGGTGYIGRRLARALLAGGHRIRQMVGALVHAVDTPPSRSTVRICEVPDIRRPGGVRV